MEGSNIVSYFEGFIIMVTHDCDISQDSFRVVTASQDLSLRVLTWKRDRDGGLTLESRYHLLGGSHTMSRFVLTFRYLCSIKWRARMWIGPNVMSVSCAFRGFSLVACDYASIVGSVEGKDGNDVLKAYTFTSWTRKTVATWVLHSLRKTNICSLFTVIDAWFYYEVFPFFVFFCLQRDNIITLKALRDSNVHDNKPVFVNWLANSGAECDQSQGKTLH